MCGFLKPKAYIVVQGGQLEFEYSVVYNSKNEIIYTTGNYTGGSIFDAQNWCKNNGYRY